MSVNLAQLKERVLSRADMVGTDFVDDDELTVFINESYVELYGMLVATFEDYFVEGPTEFTIAEGASTSSLPANFFKLLGVDVSLGGTWRNVRQFMFQERNQDSIVRRRRGISPRVTYRIMGSTLRLVPPEQAPGTYRFWYVPRVTELVEDDDEISAGVLDWAEYIIVDSAIKCLGKEESDTTTLERRKAKLTKDIVELAQNRDAGEPQRVQDVQSIDHMNDDEY